MLDIIKEYFNNDNNYVSFRNSQNVSVINKNNEFGTPTGVYTYPCKAFKEAVLKCSSVLLVDM